MCKCILGWRSVTYHFQVTVTLTSDLVLIVIVSEAYLKLFDIEIPNLVFGCILEWWSVAYHLPVTVALTSGLVFLNNRIQSISYIFEVGILNLVCG